VRSGLCSKEFHAPGTRCHDPLDQEQLQQRGPSLHRGSRYRDGENPRLEARRRESDHRYQRNTLGWSGTAPQGRLTADAPDRSVGTARTRLPVCSAAPHPSAHSVRHEDVATRPMSERKAAPWANRAPPQPRNTSPPSPTGLTSTSSGTPNSDNGPPLPFPGTDAGQQQSVDYQKLGETPPPTTSNKPTATAGHTTPTP